MSHCLSTSDSGDDSASDTDADSDQLSGDFINDGEYTQHEEDDADQDMHMHYAVNNGKHSEQENTPELCRCLLRNLPPSSSHILSCVLSTCCGQCVNDLYSFPTDQASISRSAALPAQSHSHCARGEKEGEGKGEGETETQQEEREEAHEAQLGGAM